MALDEDIARLLARWPQEFGREETRTVARSRVVYPLYYRKYGPAGPADVKASTVSIPAPHGSIPATLYEPPGIQEFAPLVIYFHGGGWIMGDAYAYDGQSRFLAKAANARLLFVEYRLAPEHRFPAAAQDALAAVRWVAAQTDALRTNPRKIFLAGDSAGGGLVALVCQRASNEGLDHIAGQFMLYPAVDLRLSDPPVPGSSMDIYGRSYFLDHQEVDWFRSFYLNTPQDATDPMASPLLADNFAGLPPAVIVTAEFDVLNDSCAEYARRLGEAGVPVRDSNDGWDGSQLHGACFDGPRAKGCW